MPTPAEDSYPYLNKPLRLDPQQRDAHTPITTKRLWQMPTDEEDTDDDTKSPGREAV